MHVYTYNYVHVYTCLCMVLFKSNDIIVATYSKVYTNLPVPTYLNKQSVTCSLLA